MTTIIIILFGILTLLAGIIILINPEMIFGYLRENIERPMLHILAVVIRLVLGAFLIYKSGTSKFPLAIEIIGWLSITASIFLGIIGRSKFRSLMQWALSLSKPYGRLGGIIAAAFGAFLISAFI